MNLSKPLVAVALSVASLGAMADGIITATSAQAPTTFASLSASGTFNPAGVNVSNLTSTYGSSFTKYTNVGFTDDTIVKFTFVGKEAGNTNAFGLGLVDSAGNRLLLNTNAPGSFVSSSVLAGAFSFYFYDVTTMALITNPSFAIGVAQGVDKTKALFVFNDNGSKDGDYDDMVVSVTAVPEVETYAMMLAGLGLMGTIARRRNKSKAV